MPVQGDTINIQRIAQNLILNALKYTGKGGVTVVWEALETEGVRRWAFSIEDTGPGFQSSSDAPLAHAIEESTLEAAAVEQPTVERFAANGFKREFFRDFAVAFPPRRSSAAGRRRRPRHRQASV